MISFNCCHCQSPLKVQDTLAGKRAKCPRCQGIVTIPSATAQPTRQRTASPAATLTLPQAPNPTSAPIDGPAATRSLEKPPDEARATRSLGDAPSLGETPSAAPASAPAEQIGRFVIRHELGEGAFGKVYEAYDPQLDRAVALKVAKLDRGDAAQRVKRFLREAKAAANLRHPHIVPVYEFGQDGERFYIAAAFIAGQTLADALEGQEPGRPALVGRTAAKIVQHLAEALAYAHGQGIVHRDVKPANVMLDEAEEPLLMDFGLATRQEEAEKLTHAGAILGTPLYMAPEQAAGKDNEPRPAGDQYSLGVLLYELLVGRPPFEGTAELVMFHHMQTEPTPPRHLHRAVPRDLETICLKCLQKDPGKRYADCRALADDLRRWLDGEPIRARRESLVRRVARRVRRYPLTVALLVSLVLAVALAGYVFIGANTARQVTTLTAQVEANLDSADWPVEGRAQVEDQIAAIDRLDPAQAAALRQRWHDRFVRFLQEGLRQGRLTAGDIERLETDIQWLAERDESRAALVREGLQQRLSQWQELLVLQDPFDQLDQAFAADLVAVRDEHLAAVPLPGRRGAGTPDPVVPTRISTQGPVRAEAEFDASWQKAAEIGLALSHEQAHRGAVYKLSFSGDGKLLASSGADRTIRVWEVATGRELLRVSEPAADVTHLALSPDGKLLAAGLTNGKLIVWDGASGQLRAAIDKAYPTCLAFSPDGSCLAVGNGRQAAVSVWKTEGLQLVATWKNQADVATHLAFGPGEQALTAITRSRAVTTWDLNTRQPRVEKKDHLSAYSAVLGLSRDGQTLACAGKQRVALCDPFTGKENAAFNWGANVGTLAVLADDGKAFATADANIRVATTKTPSPGAGHPLDERGRCTTLAFAPGGDLLAAGLDAGHIILWDNYLKATRLRLGGKGYSFVLAPNPAWLSAGPQKSAAPAATFEAARALDQPFEMRILRNGLVLHAQPVRVPAGPLRLLAHREGDRLEFQVNDTDRLVFHDIMPLAGSEQAVLGLHWPVNTALKQLVVTAQTLPPAPTALERGDRLFEQGKYAEALARYEGTIKKATSSPIKQEAQCKAGLCLVQMNRPDEARLLFGEASVGAAERWALIASSQLWLLYSQQGRFEEMDAVFTGLSGRVTPRQIAAYVPAQTRRELLARVLSSVEELILGDMKQLRRAEQVYLMVRFFEANPEQLYWSRHNLGRLCAIAGQEARARDLFREGIQYLLRQDVKGAFGNHLQAGCRFYTWMAGRTGAAAEALADLDAALFDETGKVRVLPPLQADETPLQKVNREIGYLPLYIERAQLHARLQQWDEAEKDIDTLYRGLPKDNLNYHAHATCLLLKGFLCERRGDKEGTLKAWKEGTYQAYLERLSADGVIETPLRPVRAALVFHLIMASLSDSLPDAEAQKVSEDLFGTLGDQSLMTQVATSIKVQPAVFREMWRSPRGRDLARRLAFLDLPFNEFARGPIYLCIYEKFVQDVLPGRPTPDQDAVLWHVFHDHGESFFHQKLSKTQALQLSLTYKGTTNFLGWGGIAATLTPAQRGPIAYAFGLRYLKLGRPQDATMFLRTARDDAPAQSPLKRLAEAELERLNARPQ